LPANGWWSLRVGWIDKRVPGYGFHIAGWEVG